MDGLLAQIGDIIRTQPYLAIPVCFLGGLVSSASPCVLAMIPLTIGFVGGYARGSTRRAVLFSLMFVVGLTITFTALGIIAAVFGTLFGDIGAFWKWVIPAIAILLGLYLLGVFRFGSGISERFLPKTKSLWAALAAGLIFGIAASPCATPVLGVILAFTAVQQEVVYGGLLLLAYAMGHWVLALGAGISTVFAQRVVESRNLSRFLEYFRKAGGVLLLGVGVYLLVQGFLTI
jgi:cytochrome c biogenesis protein CcdA